MMDVTKSTIGIDEKMLNLLVKNIFIKSGLGVIVAELPTQTPHSLQIFGRGK